MKSVFLNLNLADLGKGLLVAVIAAVLAYLMGCIESGGLTTVNITEVLTVSATAAIAYLFKNFITNSEGELATREDDSGSV